MCTYVVFIGFYFQRQLLAAAVVAENDIVHIVTLIIILLFQTKIVLEFL